jgi:hypothetical protein
VPRAKLACGRVGDDGDVMAAQPVRPALRPLSGRAACMAASYCICMHREPFPHALRWWRSRCASGPMCQPGSDFSCEVETCRARRRLVVGVPLVGNWSEMQPAGRRLDVCPVWVLTRVLSPPCPESLP